MHYVARRVAAVRRRPHRRAAHGRRPVGQRGRPGHQTTTAAGHDDHAGSDDHDDGAADDGAHHTTTLPATTTTHARPTTTTSSSTTTTTTPAKSTSSSKTWGWVLLAVVIALAALLVGLLIARTRRQGREVDWDRSVVPAVTAAELAASSILSQTNADDAQHRATVAVQVDDAVDGLERAAAAAPDEANRALCMRCADSLRGLAFAVEADHLMRSGGQTPTGEQLASADSARRNRSAELNRALEDLKLAIAPKK